MSFEHLVSEAEENLRLIREYMERSKRYSNFAGFSGICGGLYAIAGMLVQRLFVLGLPKGQQPTGFVVNWLIVIALALGTDYVFTRRRRSVLNKGVLVRLTRHMARAAWPALLVGIVFSVALIASGQQNLLYPYWMLSYGLAISAVAVSAPREVSWLGYSFLGFGAFTLLAQTLSSPRLAEAQFGLVMFGLTFGVIHIAYGVVVALREGW